MTPEALERFRPFVKRPYRLGLGSIKHPPAVAAYVDKAHLEQNAQVLRNRGLRQPQRVHNFPHWPLPPRLRHVVKHIRGCRCSCHGPTIHSHMGMCQAVFLVSSPRSLLALAESPLRRPFPFFRLSIRAQRSRVPPTLWRISHEPTSSALAVDSCRGGVSDLRTLRRCCGRAVPEQGAD